MKRAFLFVIASILLLYLVRELEYEGVRRNESGEFGKLRETFLEAQDYDMIYIGSSRAECSFYPPVIDSMTGLRSYNIGMTGATMPFIRASLEAYLVNSKAPEYVVLNLDIHSFTDSPDTIFDFPRYFPYLSNPALLKGLQEADHRFTAFRWLAPYSMPYFNAHYLDASLRGWTNKPGNYDAAYTRGWAPSLPNDSIGDLDTITIRPFVSEPPAFIWENLDRIDSICKKNNIRLILVLSPIFPRLDKQMLNAFECKMRFRSYATSKELAFIDLSGCCLFDKRYYSDPAHLNPAGAREFSLDFSGEVRQYLSP